MAARMGQAGQNKQDMTARQGCQHGTARIRQPDPEVWSSQVGDRISSLARNQLQSPCSTVDQVLVVANSKSIPHRKLILS